MSTVGEDIMNILGLIPVRDRAGIQRANMAQLALANSGNAEGQALIQQGQRPPMPTAPADVDTTGAIESPTAAPPPAPVTRTVAAAPAGATTALDTALARHDRAQQMNDVFGSLQKVFYGLSRDPDTQAQGRGIQLAGGGDKIHDIVEISKHRQDLLAKAREAEDTEAMIQSAMTLYGWDRTRARAYVTSKGKDNAAEILSPAAQKTYQQDKVNAAERQRILNDPELLKEAAANAGISEKFMRSRFEAGENIDTKGLSHLAHERGETAKTGVDAERTKGETAKEREAALSFEEARKDPVEFAKRYPQLDTPEKVTAALTNRPTYEEFTKKALPNATPHLQEWTQDEQRRKQLGLPSRSLPEFVAAMQPRHVETPEEKTAAERGKAETTYGYGGELKKISEQRDAANDARTQLKTVHEVQQAAWTPDLITGPWAEYSLPVKRALAAALGYQDKDVSNTGVWQATMKDALIQLQKDMKGATSNNDVKLVADAVGSDKWDPDTIKRIQQLREIAQSTKIKDYNDNIAAFYKRNPNAPKGLYQPEEYPMPGRMIMDDLARPENKNLAATVRATPDRLVDFEGRKITVSELVRRNFGPHTLDHMLKGDI